MPKPKVIAIVGPTATGKTALGVRLARALDSEVISADSRVIYRELNIGTAKPTMEERQGVAHHLIDVVDPEHEFSAAQYRAAAEKYLDDLFSAGKTPVVVGGTGFYLRALLEENVLPEIAPDDAFRAEMNRLEDENGAGFLHKTLTEKDAVRAQALHPNDRFRLIRALEIIEKTGQTVSQMKRELPFEVVSVGLNFGDRAKLDKRIDDRIDAMLAAGWLEEVKALVEKYGPDARGIQLAMGYPELVAVTQLSATLEGAVEQIQINTHQYARRQMTWFRKNPKVQWFNVDEMGADEIFEKTLALSK